MSQAPKSGPDGQAERFRRSLGLLRCPLCAGKLRVRGQSLVCARRHCFDVARQGYVNFLPMARPSRNYDAGSFKSRQLILESGFYDHMLEALASFLEAEPHLHTILDAGCGEGYYARRLSGRLNREILASDLSRDSILLAARGDRERAVLWFVGDLSHLPLQDRSVDCVLNLFSPASYQEFRRVLKPGGRLIKLVPGDRHLQELREKAGPALRQQAYSSEATVTWFQKHFKLLEQRRLSACLPLSADEREALLAMTPLLFNVDRERISWDDLHHVTIEAEMLVGRA